MAPVVFDRHRVIFARALQRFRPFIFMTWNTNVLLYVLVCCRALVSSAFYGTYLPVFRYYFICGWNLAFCLERRLLIYRTRPAGLLSER